jgi:hypothetical protein
VYQVNIGFSIEINLPGIPGEFLDPVWAFRIAVRVMIQGLAVKKYIHGMTFYDCILFKVNNTKIIKI